MATSMPLSAATASPIFSHAIFAHIFFLSRQLFSMILFYFQL
jgi:hypothetical protein